MCGIVAYVGNKTVVPLLMEGLKRLEYRGYDSAGVAVITRAGMQVQRSVGRVAVLAGKVAALHGFDGTIGIAHTRWATHGAPSHVNAHPHCGSTRDGRQIAVVHNGIIENYVALRTYLTGKGHEFASDASAIVAHTDQVITLDDYQVARLCAGPTDRQTDSGGPWSVDFRTTTIDNVPVTREIRQLEFDLAQIELGDHPHFMLKEIMEQPEVIRNCLRGRIDDRQGRVVLGGLEAKSRELMQAQRIVLTAQGTAYHAGLIGEYLMEDLAKLPARCEYASEFRYRNPIIEPGTIVVAVSQSGETADTLAALSEAQDRGAMALGVVNVVGSSIARQTDAGVYLHVGPEVGVASTKAFVGQVAVLTLLALYIGRRRFLSDQASRSYIEQLQHIGEYIDRILEQSDHIRTCVERYVDRNNWLFLGRGYNYPIALEGALKLKELSYIHAEGMPAAEMKHGPIALIDEGMPVVFVAPRDSQYAKVISNIEEVRARGGRIIAVATEGDTDIQQYADSVFYVPPVPDALQPLLTVVPLQLLAYHAAVLKGHDVDKPRNLAKSVTVE